MMQQMQAMMRDPNTMNMIQQMMSSGGGLGGMAQPIPSITTPATANSTSPLTEEEMVQEAIRLSLSQDSTTPSTPPTSATPSVAAAPQAAPRVVTSKEEFDTVLTEAGETLVCVNFTAVWCPPCQRMAPVYAALAQEFPEVIFLKVDVDANPVTKTACGITSMPTYQFYKEGTKVAEFSGANESRIRSTIAEFTLYD